MMGCIADDSEFEVTAEMLIHDDVDDEGTLAEEEALQCREEVEEEVDDLQKVRSLNRVGIWWEWVGGRRIAWEGEGGKGERRRGELPGDQASVSTDLPIIQFHCLFWCLIVGE